MRIISDFHDYYDCIQKYGMDEDVVWIRKERTRIFQSPPSIYAMTYSKSRPAGKDYYPLPFCFARPRKYLGISKSVPLLHYRTHIVGFCGKIHPCLEVTADSSNAVAFCYCTEDLDNFVSEHIADKDKEYYYETRRRKNQDRACRGQFDTFFDHCESVAHNYHDLFVEERSPVFVGTKSGTMLTGEPPRIVYNARLEPLEFFREVDTVQAFQAISAFVGGVLGGTREVLPEVDDKTLAEAKGFDKWSFRKEPKK